MQMTLSLDLALPERFTSLREYVAHRVTVQAKPAKTIAADMDIAPSTLSRKLNPSDGDTQRFNLDDFEAWLASTGDAAAAIESLAAKFLDTDTARHQRVVANVERLMAELARQLPALKAGSA
jgi:DNA transposition AAA+ family ATPase